MGADERMGKNLDTAFVPTYKIEKCENQIIEGEKCLKKIKFTPQNGDEYYLADYSSIGKDWKSVIAAWLPTKR
jgi:hypothetical protein